MEPATAGRKFVGVTADAKAGRNVRPDFEILKVMKRILVIALVAAVAAAALEWGALRRARYDNASLRRNQEVLTAQAAPFRTRLGERAAGAAALPLKVGELERLRADDARELRNLRIRLRRAESLARSGTDAETRFAAPLESAADTAPGALSRSADMAAGTEHRGAGIAAVGDVRGSGGAAAGVVRRAAEGLPLAPPLPAARSFRWSDRWTTVAGVVTADSVYCAVTSVDTLVQAVYRVPRRFLGIPFATKAVRQEIVSKNPHNRVVYTEYVRLERRRGR